MKLPNHSENYPPFDINPYNLLNKSNTCAATEPEKNGRRLLIESESDKLSTKMLNTLLQSQPTLFSDKDGAFTDGESKHLMNVYKCLKFDLKLRALWVVSSGNRCISSCSDQTRSVAKWELDVWRSSSIDTRLKSYRNKQRETERVSAGRKSSAMLFFSSFLASLKSKN